MALTSANEVLGLAEKIKEFAVPVDSLSASKVTVDLPDFEATNAADAFEELKQGGSSDTVICGVCENIVQTLYDTAAVGTVTFPTPMADTNYVITLAATVLATTENPDAQIYDGLSVYYDQKTVNGFRIRTRAKAGLVTCNVDYTVRPFTPPTTGKKKTIKKK